MSPVVELSSRFGRLPLRQRELSNLGESFGSIRKAHDQLPLPALDLMDMALYTQRTDGVIRRHNLSAATLVASRGCLRKCRFCAESLTYGQGVRLHSPPYVLDWIKRVVADYHVDGIHFHDNDFLADEQWAQEVCHGILDAGLDRRIRWSIQARADHLNREMARLLKASGCVLVEIGIETGVQDELDPDGQRHFGSGE